MDVGESQFPLVGLTDEAREKLKTTLKKHGLV